MFNDLQSYADLGDDELIFMLKYDILRMQELERIVKESVEHIIERTVTFHTVKRMVENLQEIDLWKILIEKDPTFSTECPIEFLQHIKPKFVNLAKMGVF